MVSKKAPDGAHRLNLNFPVGLHKRVKQMALDLDTSVTALFVKWATESVERHERKRAGKDTKSTEP